MKKCVKCGLNKPQEEFYSQRLQCKECYNFYRKEKYNTDINFRKKRTRQIQDRKYFLRKTDPVYRLKYKISQRIRLLCKTGKCEKQLLKKYNIDAKEIIDNIGLRPGEDYHLDHIIPVSAFNHNDVFEVYCCWNYKNLRWLSSKENLLKSDKYDTSSKEKYLNEMKKNVSHFTKILDYITQ